MLKKTTGSEAMCFRKTALSIALIFGLAARAQSPAANLKTADNSRSNDSKAAAPAASPSKYLVGESDVLHINVWKEPEITQTVVVRTDGNISLPLIDEVKVAGMTPLQIQGTIAERLRAFLNNPQVTVTVTEIHSKRAFITGEVARPGGYSLNTETSVLQLIAQAGGLTPFAKRDSIIILRLENGKQQRLPFKYSEVVQGKSAEQNFALHPGDTVVVP